MNKERKNNLLTIRLTNNEKHALDSLTERMDKSKSDVMLRACKYFSSVGGGYLGGSREAECEDKGEGGYGRLVHRVHLRMSDEDMDGVRTQSEASGETISQLIRRAIMALADGMGIHY